MIASILICVIALATGFFLGYGIYFLQSHKESLSYDIEILKSDLINVQVKLDKIITSILSHSS